MDYYLNEQQIEELENFDHIANDLSELFEELEEFNMKDYLNSNIDYWNEFSYFNCQRSASSEWS